MIRYKSHHVHLMSHDAMGAAEFYIGVKQCLAPPWKHPKVPMDPGAALPRANMMLGDQFMLISTVDEKVTQTATGPHSCLGLDHIGISVDDLEAAAAELKAKG